MATLLNSDTTHHNIAVWDLSRLATRSHPGLLGLWHESDYDATYFEIIEYEGYWEAYYLVQAVNRNLDPVGQVWKFAWPEKKYIQVLTLPPGNVSGLAVLKT